MALINAEMTRSLDTAAYHLAEHLPRSADKALTLQIAASQPGHTGSRVASAIDPETRPSKKAENGKTSLQVDTNWKHLTLHEVYKVSCIVQYGRGKGNTLNTLWDRLRKHKTEIEQHTTSDIFNPNSEEWLSSQQISNCLTLLLHTTYRFAAHPAAIGSAQMICSDKTLKILLRDASQSPLPAETDQKY